MRLQQYPEQLPGEDKGPSGAVRIQNAAMTLFLEKGYRLATVRGIAAKAEVTQGLVTYHFGTKDHLAHEIYMEMTGQIYERITLIVLKNRDISVAERLYVTYMAGLELLDRDEKRARFFYELITETDVVDTISPCLLEIIDRIILSYHLDVSRKTYQIITAVMLGSQRMLVRLHRDSPKEFTCQDIADSICSDLFYNLGMPDREIAGIMKKGLKYVKTLPI